MVDKAEIVKIRKSTISHVSTSLKKLENKGLVEKIQSKDNKKHIEIILLDKAGFQEIQDFYGVSRTTLVTWIREEGIPTIDVGRAKRVRKDVFDDVLKSKRKVEGDT